MISVGTVVLGEQQFVFWAKGRRLFTDKLQGKPLLSLEKGGADGWFFWAYHVCI